MFFASKKYKAGLGISVITLLVAFSSSVYSDEEEHGGKDVSKPDFLNTDLVSSFPNSQTLVYSGPNGGIIRSNTAQDTQETINMKNWTANFNNSSVGESLLNELEKASKTADSRMPLVSGDPNDVLESPSMVEERLKAFEEDINSEKAVGSDFSSGEPMLPTKTF